MSSNNIVFVNTNRRNSSFELLRILSMLMILLLHANFFTFNAPEGHTFVAFLRCYSESVTLIAVNVFVLITGWFGTSFSFKKVLSLIFQVTFAILPVSLILILSGKYQFNIKGFNFLNYWYINAYIGLLIFTPILNVAISRLTRKQLKVFLISFYIVFALSDFLLSVQGLGLIGGYSVIWFIFLYVFARYIRTYSTFITKYSNAKLLVLFLFFSMCEAFLLFFKYKKGTHYDGPFVFIESMLIIILFSRFNFYNKWINVIASSSLMVYLLNLHPLLVVIFKFNLISLFSNVPNPIIFSFLALGYCLLFYLISISYDYLRIILWGCLVDSYNKLTQKSI